MKGHTTTPKEIRKRNWDEYIDLLSFMEKRRIPIQRYAKLYFPTRRLKYRNGSVDNTKENIETLRLLKAKILEITAIYETR